MMSKLLAMSRRSNGLVVSDEAVGLQTAATSPSKRSAGTELSFRQSRKWRETGQSYSSSYLVSFSAVVAAVTFSACGHGCEAFVHLSASKVTAFHEALSQNTLRLPETNSRGRSFHAIGPPTELLEREAAVLEKGSSLKFRPTAAVSGRRAEDPYRSSWTTSVFGNLEADIYDAEYETGEFPKDVTLLEEHKLELKADIQLYLRMSPSERLLQNRSGSRTETKKRKPRKVSMRSGDVKQAKMIKRVRPSSSTRSGSNLEKKVETVVPSARTIAGSVATTQQYGEDIDTVEELDFSFAATKDELNWAGPRISPEEELELARVIQRGSELEKIKTDFESTNGRQINKKEWANLAGVESPAQLRRLVSDYRRAKNKLVMANMGLVHAVVAGKLGGGRIPRGKGVTDEELVQEGSLGLIRAAELFDPSRGLRFSTYATIWIKGVLSNSAVDEIIALPSRAKTKWNKIVKAKEDLIAEHEAIVVEEDATNEGGDARAQQIKSPYRPTQAEIAARCGMEESEVKTIIKKFGNARSVLSLDYQYTGQSRSGADTSTFGGFSNDRALIDDENVIHKMQVRADVVAALVRNLNEREVLLMRLRYGLKDGISRTIAECAEEMGISRRTVHHIASKCLKKLREADEAESLQEYLSTIA